MDERANMKSSKTEPLYKVNEVVWAPLIKILPEKDIYECFPDSHPMNIREKGKIGRVVHKTSRHQSHINDAEQEYAVDFMLNRTYKRHSGPRQVLFNESELMSMPPDYDEAHQNGV